MISRGPSRCKSQESNTHKNVTWKLLGPPPVLPMNGTVESEPRAWGQARKSSRGNEKTNGLRQTGVLLCQSKGNAHTARIHRKEGGVSNCFCSDLQMETLDRPPGHCLLLLKGRSRGFNITLNNRLYLRGLEKLPRCCRLATILTLRRSISDFPSRPGMWELFMGN